MLLHSLLPAFFAFLQIGFSIAYPRPSPQQPNFSGAVDAAVLGNLVTTLGSLIDQANQANEAGNGPLVLTLANQMAGMIPAINQAVAAIGQDAFNVQGPQSQQDIISAVRDVRSGNDVFGGIVLLLKYVWYDQNDVRQYLQILKNTFLANAARFAGVTAQGATDPTGATTTTPGGTTP